MYRHDLIDQMQVGDREDYNDQQTEEIPSREQVEDQVYKFLNSPAWKTILAACAMTLLHLLLSYMQRFPLCLFNYT